MSIVTQFIVARIWLRCKIDRIKCRFGVHDVESGVFEADLGFRVVVYCERCEAILRDDTYLRRRIQRADMVTRLAKQETVWH